MLPVPAGRPVESSGWSQCFVSWSNRGNGHCWSFFSWNLPPLMLFLWFPRLLLFSPSLSVGVAEGLVPHLAQHVLFLGDLAHICGFMTHEYLTSSLDVSWVMTQRAGYLPDCRPVVHGRLELNISLTDFTVYLPSCSPNTTPASPPWWISQDSASWLGQG